MKPIQGMKKSNVWKPARRVWFQRNDDDKDIKTEIIRNKDFHTGKKTIVIKGETGRYIAEDD
jgi:hypothetical protein